MLFQELIATFNQESMIEELKKLSYVTNVESDAKELRVEVKADTRDDQIKHIHKMSKPWPVHIMIARTSK